MAASASPAKSALADPVARAAAFGPRLRELAPQIEREGKLPKELVAELSAAGMFQMLLPESLGGSETDPVAAARAVEEVSAGDGSAGWCVMIAGQCAAFAGFLPEDHAKEVWGNHGVVASTARPIGRAIPAGERAEGFTVSGRWPFASGSSHATWFGGECTIYDGETPRLDSQGNAVTRMLFVPRDAVTIHETWDTIGLRGTASNDFSIDGVFVPAARGFQVLVDQPIHPWAVYQAPPLFFINHGAQALGVAKAAIATAAEVAAVKPGWGTSRPMREQPRLQAIFAEATVLRESAAQYLYATAGELWDAAVARKQDTTLLRGRVRLATSHAVRASVQAVDLVYAAVGTSSVFKKSPLERQFRDIHTAAAHVMVAPLTYEAAGRVELGLEAAFPFF